MILHLGGDAVVLTEDIIAIIDLEASGQVNINKEFIKTAEEEGFIKYISQDPPKSLVLAEENKNTVVYMSPISSVTLMKRSKYIDDISFYREENKGDNK